MNAQSFITFLEKFRITDKDRAENRRQTHTSMLDPAGAFHVPEEHMHQFWKLYQAGVRRGEMFHVTESHLEQGPIVIDLDMKYSVAANAPARAYTHEHIKQVLRVYNSVILTFLEVDADDFLAYVFEKPVPTPDGEDGDRVKYKDGVHVMYPEICASSTLQHLIREMAIAEFKKLGTFDALNLDNPVEDVIDKAVISKNNWMLYGSCKSKDPTRRYALTKVWNYDFEETPLEDIDMLGLPKHLSVKKFPLKAHHTPFRESYDHEQVTKLYDSLVESRNKARGVTVKRRPQGDDDVRRARALTVLLKPQRCESYQSWIEVGFCLHNIDDSLLEDWIAFSKQSPKFKEGECERMWDKFRDEGLGIGSLHRWAKEDNPTAYADFMLAEFDGVFMDSLIGTSGAVAKAFYELNRYNYVCASVRNQEWFEFREHRWQRMDSATGIFKRLNDEFSSDYLRLSIVLANRAIAYPNEKETLIERQKQAVRISQRLGTLDFKKQVIGELAHRYYDPDFLKELDETSNLICFTNGVYDLQNCEFREGRPEDRLNLCTGIKYVPFNPRDPNVLKVLNFIEQVMPEEDMREYVIRLLASFLYGSQRDQKFHIWTGSGSNGKSLLIKLYHSVLGDYATTISCTFLTNKRPNSSAANPDLAKTKGKRFVSLQEPENDDTIQVGNMKSITGDDMITARGLYKEPVDFMPRFKAILACNKLPKIPSNDGGTWRRIRVVPFEVKFVDDPKKPHERKVDRTLSDQINGWKEAFMSLLVHKLKDYKEHGIVEPKKVLALTDEYQKKSDAFQEFIDDCIVETENPDDAINIRSIFSIFKVWAKDNPALKNTNRNDLLEDLKSKLVKDERRSDVFRGYVIRPKADDDRYQLRDDDEHAACD